jgi:hypothetical protein
MDYARADSLELVDLAAADGSVSRAGLLGATQAAMPVTALPARSPSAPGSRRGDSDDEDEEDFKELSTESVHQAENQATVTSVRSALSRITAKVVTGAGAGPAHGSSGVSNPSTPSGTHQRYHAVTVLPSGMGGGSPAHQHEQTQLSVRSIKEFQAFVATRNRNTIELAWRDLTVTTKGGGKVLLKPVSGAVSGKLLAIMGPSGMHSRFTAMSRKRSLKNRDFTRLPTFPVITLRLRKNDHDEHPCIPPEECNLKGDHPTPSFLHGVHLLTSQAFLRQKGCDDHQRRRLYHV